MNEITVHTHTKNYFSYGHYPGRRQVMTPFLNLVQMGGWAKTGKWEPNVQLGAYPRCMCCH